MIRKKNADRARRSGQRPQAPPLSKGEDAPSRTVMTARAPGAARCKGPLPDGARIYVDKLSFGVITDATRAERKRSVPQLYRWNALHPDIECIPFNMFGVLRSVGGSTFAQCIVGLLGSVAAKDIDDAA